MKKTATFFCLIGLSSASPSAFAVDLYGDSLQIGTGNTFGTSAGWSVAIGEDNNMAEGVDSLFMGSFNDFSGAYVAHIMGDENSGYADASLCAGGYNTIEAGSSLVAGNYNSASVGSSLLVGEYNHGAIGYGLIVGYNNYIEGGLQFALGQGLINHSSNSVSSVYLGQYNVSSTITPPPLLVIGNGADATHRANALEVARDGRARFNNSLEIYAVNYNPANANSGKIVVQPSTSGSSITIDGRPLLAPNPNGNLYLDGTSTGNVILNANGGGGNVGIGTNSPQAKLSVNGNASLGTGVTSAADQVVVGKYNDTRTNDSGVDHTLGVFVVGAGTGTGTSAANAIRVLADGTVLVKNSGDLAMGTFTNGPRP